MINYHESSKVYHVLKINLHILCNEITVQQVQLIYLRNTFDYHHNKWESVYLLSMH